MAADAPAIRVLTGPTAVGKTEAAMRWAEEHDAEILSCDSVCVYRGMDIGTAKPSRSERSSVRHHLIDMVDADEPFTVARFQAGYREVIADIAARGGHPLLVGGTGL